MINPRINPELYYGNLQVNLVQALCRAFLKTSKVGLDRLRAAGWTTQKWFQTVKPGTDSAANGIDCLRPAWALADMISRAQDKRVRKAWLPDPEDLDLAALDRPKLQQDAQAALRVFALVPDALSTPGYARIYLQLNSLE